MPDKNSPTWITLPELTDYNQAIEIMNQYVEDIIIGTGPETILLLEHDDVYTAGSSSLESELLNNNNIPVIYTGRGGKFTYHGQGQRVIYPILDLKNANRVKDIKLYVRNLENWIINTLALINIKAYTIKGMVGIWVGDSKGPAKIAAIGVRVKKWVTYHGIAINISTDLNKFNGIIPCGINNFSVTSLEKLGINISFDEFDKLLKQEFRKVFS
ncbi:MAG: lipoyl(octanoyl) transferase LipB [Rickettsiales bacterium]|nr:MAG: lipoyl(octanoyl) transferase LipB [Rickettsiales bacterium]